nr:aquaporin TIP4-1 [Ipomoea batatas]
MPKIELGNASDPLGSDCIKALIVEFICMFLFVFTGVGASMAAEQLQGNALVGLFFVAMAHALVVGVMVGVGFRISGAHLNPAVTLGLLMGGHITIIRSFLYCIDQLLASVAACAMLTYITPAHTLASGVSCGQGVVMEIILTFYLLFTVYATIVDPNKGNLDGLGPLQTGLVVGANIMAGGSFSGASMNPARSFGPAFVSGNWANHWVYWVGPLIGEYGMGSDLSIFGDMYSYGILLLEIFTSKCPTSDIFNNGLTLHNYVRMSMPEQVIEIVDPKLFNEEANATPRSLVLQNQIIECLVSIFKIGIACSMELPRDRMSIGNAVKELHSIKDTLVELGDIRTIPRAGCTKEASSGVCNFNNPINRLETEIKLSKVAEYGD